MSEAVKITYCADCGNTGVALDGSMCHCRVNVKSFYDKVDCLEIPEQYRNVPFNEQLVPKDMPEAYKAWLTKVHEEICSLRYKYQNVVLCSPINHSKTIWAYSIMERLFRAGIETFPMFDVLEIKRIITDMDLCRKQLYDVDKPENLFKVPYLFCKIPRIPTWEVYDTVGILIDRRTRRDHSTVFLFDGDWFTLQNYDKQGLIKSLIGKGTYNSVLVQNFNTIAVPAPPEVQLKPNLG